MICLKCGRDTGSDLAFCESCAADMKAYPVKPDAVVQLPPSKPRLVPKKAAVHRRQNLSEQEQIRRLRLRLRRLWIALVIVLAILIAVCGFNIRLLTKARQPLPGQNYSTAPAKPAIGEK